MRRPLLAIALAVMVSGCSNGLASPTPATPKASSTTAPLTPKASYSLAPPTPTLSPIATVAPTGHARPYTPEQLAIALRENVPYNFPPQLQAAWVAQALADRIWTYDGRPYRRLGIHASCGEPPIRCDLTVEGLPAFAPTTDVSDYYVFEVNMTAGVFTPAGTPSLRGFPQELAPELDALARSLDTGGRLAEQRLLNVMWALPPPDDGFALWYQTGYLEGARILLVTLDRANRKILSIEVTQEGLGG